MGKSEGEGSSLHLSPPYELWVDLVGATSARRGLTTGMPSITRKGKGGGRPSAAAATALRQPIRLFLAQLHTSSRTHIRGTALFMLRSVRLYARRKKHCDWGASPRGPSLICEESRHRNSPCWIFVLVYCQG